MQSNGTSRAGEGSQLLSFALVLLVSTAIAAPGGPLFFAIITGAILPGMALQRLFPSNSLLWIAFVNLVAIYASVFALFVDEVFVDVRPTVLSAGFALPIVAFVIGCWLQRDAVRGAISDPPPPADRNLGVALLWLAPVWLIGVVVVVTAQATPNLIGGDATFLAAMALIGAIVAAVSRAVALFLIEIGVLFEEFFERVRHLLVPAFAFLTVYSLLVVVFAAAYAILSKVGMQDHFRIASVARALSFPEALHFSITTLSTVGYGDIVPASGLGRGFAAIQVVVGTLLLLFGVSEILEYSRERRREREKTDKSDRTARP
jgi:voltage-gated potassium channel